MPFPFHPTVAVSPDGARIAVGLVDIAVVLHGSTLAEQRRLSHPARDLVVDFLPDGRLATSGSHSNQGLLWDAATGQQLGTAASAFACADSWGAAWHCDTSGRGIQVRYLSGSDPQVLRHGWDGVSLSPLTPISERRGTYLPVLAAGSGDRVVIGGEGAQSFLRTERVVDHLPVPGGDLATYGYPLGEVERPLRASAGWLRLWQGEALHCENMELPAGVTAVALAEGPLAGLEDGRVVSLSPLCEVVATIQVGTTSITSLAPMSGQRAVTVSADGTVALLDLRRGTVVRSVQAGA